MKDRFNGTVTGGYLDRDNKPVFFVRMDDGRPVTMRAPTMLEDGRRVLVEGGRITEAGVRG